MKIEEFITGKNVRDMEDALFENEEFVRTGNCGMLLTGIATLIISAVLCLAVL